MLAKLLLSAAIFAAGTATSYAWDNTITGPGPNQIVDGGPGAQATARASARASSASFSGAQGGAGGAGGSARARGGSANATGGTVNINGGGFGDGSGGRGNTGGVFITVPDGMGQAPCGGGIGIGGLGLGGGGSGGGTLWEFGDCKTVREAAALKSLGRPDLALRELCQQISRVREAMGGTCDAPAAPAPGPEVYRYDYCLTASAGELRQHKECLAGR